MDKNEEGEKFTQVTALEFWESAIAEKEASSEKWQREGEPSVKVTGMPGKHVPDGVLGTLNDLLGAVPPTNGWMVELGSEGAGGWDCGYR